MATLEERLAKAKNVTSLQQRLEAAQVSTGQAIGHNLSKTVGDNLLAIPSAAGEIVGKGLAGTAAAVEGVGSVLTGGNFDFARRANDQLTKFPASALNSIPRPTVNDLGAAVRSIPALLPGGQSPSERFQSEKLDFEAEDARIRESRPVASTVGDVGGDIMTLLTGRLPNARNINAIESKLANKTPDLFFGKVPTAPPPGAARLLDDVINSPTMRKLARGAGRSVEAGFEALALDILNGDDPLETAAYAAGGQLAGSAALELGKGLFSGGPLKAGTKITIAALSAGSLIKLAQDVTPGGEDSFIGSMEAGYEKVAFAGIAGVLSTLAGSGRLRGGRRAEDLPKLTDALAAVPRGAMISLLEDYVNASKPDQRKVDAVIQQLVEDPEHFGKDLPKLEKALNDGNFVPIVLMSDSDDLRRLMFKKPPELKEE